MQSNFNLLNPTHIERSHGDVIENTLSRQICAFMSFILQGPATRRRIAIYPIHNKFATHVHCHAIVITICKLLGFPQSHDQWGQWDCVVGVVLGFFFWSHWLEIVRGDFACSQTQLAAGKFCQLSFYNHLWCSGFHSWWLFLVLRWWLLPNWLK